MKTRTIKQVRRQRRKVGIRKRIFGTASRPRLTVYRSLNHMYAQVIDDLTGKTLVSASSLGLGSIDGDKKAIAARVGEAIAQKAKGAGISSVSFDRNGFRYHGRIRCLADAAREAGLSL